MARDRNKPLRAGWRVGVNEDRATSARNGLRPPMKRRGPFLSNRRRPSRYRRSLGVELAGDVPEDRAETAADSREGDDRGDRDQGCDEAVFDRRRARFVVHEARENYGHVCAPNVDYHSGRVSEVMGFTRRSRLNNTAKLFQKS